MMQLSPAQYLTLGYAIALGLLWGYAILMWWQLRITRPSAGRGSPPDRS